MKKLLLICAIALSFASCKKESTNVAPDIPYVSSVTFNEAYETGSSSNKFIIINVNLVTDNTIAKIGLLKNGSLTQSKATSAQNATMFFDDRPGGIPVGAANKRVYAFIFTKTDGSTVTSRNFDCYK